MKKIPVNIPNDLPTTNTIVHGHYPDLTTEQEARNILYFLHTGINSKTLVEILRILEIPKYKYDQIIANKIAYYPIKEDEK